MMNRMRKVCKSKEGFTLIELMVVLAVLGILAAVAIPRFNDMRGKANLVKAKSELKQVQTAMELYYAEHSAYPLDDDTFDTSLSDYIVETDLSDYGTNGDLEYSKTDDGYSVTASYTENSNTTTFVITRDDITVQ